MLSRKSMASLAQFLALQRSTCLAMLFEKHGLETHGFELANWGNADLEPAVLRSLEAASDNELQMLLTEIAGTERDLRFRIVPKYRYDERHADLLGHLEIDGYRLSEGELREIEPVLVGAPPLADDLRDHIANSGLPRKNDVQRLIDQAIGAFSAEQPNYNSALGNARVALETLALDIAEQRPDGGSQPFDPKRWAKCCGIFVLLISLPVKKRKHWQEYTPS